MIKNVSNNYFIQEMSDHQSKKKGGKRKGDEDQEDTEEGLGIQQKMTKRKKKSKHK